MNYYFSIVFFIISAFLFPLNCNAFVPDPDIKIVADHFDKKYFPIFLNSLTEIKNGKYELAHRFFDKTLYDSFLDKKPIKIDTYEINENIIFLNSNLRDENGYLINFPINWAANPTNNNTWVFNLHNLLWLNPYLDRGERGDEASTFIAVKVIKDWIIANSDYPPTISKFAFDDHATAERLTVFLRALRVYQKLSVQDSDFTEILLTSMLGHIALIASEEKYLNWHNHGVIFDVRLLDVLNKFPEFLYKEELQNLAIKRVVEQLRFSFTDEGVHREHTPCYHYHVSSMLLKAIELIGESGHKIPEGLIELSDKTAEFYTYTLEPDGTFPNIGDCSGEKKWFPYVQGDIGKRYYENHPELRYALSGGTEGNKPKDLIKIFPESGWAIFRDQWPTKIMAIVQSDFYSFGHYQEDDTSFILNAYGYDFIIDNGLYSYDKGPMEDYMRRSRAHNVLLVNNEDFNFNLKNTGLSGITRFLINNDEHAQWKGIVELTHGHYLERGVEVFRQFGQIDDNSFSVVDIVKTADINEYSQIFHFAPNAKVTLVEKGIIKITWEGNPYTLWFLSDFDSFSVVEGETNPIQGWYFPSFKVAKQQPTLILKKTGAGLEFKTLISLNNGQAVNWHQLSVASEIMHKSLNNVEATKMLPRPVPAKWKINR